MFETRLLRPGELMALCDVRHEVFVGEGWMAADDGASLTDAFDGLATTMNVVAVADDTIIGAARFAPYVDGASPASAYYDFARHVDVETCLTAGMFCVRPGKRGGHVARALMRMSILAATERDRTHLVASANPAIEGLLGRMGWHRVADPFTHAESGLPCLPMVLEVDCARPAYLEYVERQRRLGGVESFHRVWMATSDHAQVQRASVAAGSIHVVGRPAGEAVGEGASVRFDEPTLVAAVTTTELRLESSPTDRTEVVDRAEDVAA